MAPSDLLRKLVRRHFARPQLALAKAHRTVLGTLGGICWVGVTGSCGKTMTKELIAAVLSARGPGRKSNRMYNGPQFVAETMFTVLPWHRFCVHELGTQSPGQMAASVAVFRPQIGVVTNIGGDHHASFRNKETTAAEKGTLVESLPAEGTAVLNADDPYVLAMRDRSRARVITYGLSADAMVCGEAAACAWPDTLSFTARYGGETVPVHTQLLGEHWISAVLAALATGIAVGMRLTECAHAVAGVKPADGRMSQHQTPDGITFIRDDWKAPFWTIPASLRFMQAARARRRVVIIGTISDYPGSASPKYRATARQALTVAEKVIFVGKYARSTLKVRCDASDDRIMAFDSVYALHLFLRGYLASGDLVLLKGSGGADHLQRLVLARSNDIACWRENCDRFIFCTQCRFRRAPYVPDRPAHDIPAVELGTRERL